MLEQVQYMGNIIISGADALTSWSSGLVTRHGRTLAARHPIVRMAEHRIICVCFHMFLQILWAFEGFAAEFAFVRLEGNMNSNMRGYVIALHGGRTASPPLTL